MEDKFLDLMEEKGHVFFFGLKKENPNFDEMMEHLDNQIEFHAMSVPLKRWIREDLSKGKRNFKWTEDRKGRVRKFLSQGLNKSLNTHEHTLLTSLYDEECSFLASISKKMIDSDVKKIHKKFYENPKQLEDFKNEIVFRLSNEHPDIYKGMLTDYLKHNDIKLDEKLSVIEVSAGITPKDRNLLNKMRKFNAQYK